MFETAVIWDWVSYLVRWVHVITAVAWIGTSLYFIALDLGLKKHQNLPEGVLGEEWQVHGGGFYHVQKYMVAPDHMPDGLTWFKWESYSTWLSGAALLMIIYWVGGELFLLDPAKSDLELWQGIAISGSSLAVGWLAYDQMCKSRLGNHPTVLMLLLFLVIVAMSWGYDQIFTGRAAALHIGALTATIMIANVFMVIIPNQTIVVADLKAGKTPDAKYGIIAKQRSTHNNYMTLPVVFLMLSNHFPLVHSTAYSWLIFPLIFLPGVTIRHFFNTMHRTGEKLWWTWFATALIIIATVWLSTISRDDDPKNNLARTPTQHELRFVNVASFPDAYRIVASNCVACHAREPAWAGILRAPGGIILETPLDVARQARAIYLHAGLSTAMPPGNANRMDEASRRAIVAWYREAVEKDG